MNLVCEMSETYAAAVFDDWIETKLERFAEIPFENPLIKNFDFLNLK